MIAVISINLIKSVLYFAFISISFEGLRKLNHVTKLNSNKRGLRNKERWLILGILFTSLMREHLCEEILMVSVGVSRSHKVPFYALAEELISRNHTVTMIHGLPPASNMSGLEEIIMSETAEIIMKRTNWDLIGSKMRGEKPYPFYEAFNLTIELCKSMYSGAKMKKFINSGRHYDLVIMDSLDLNCFLGLPYSFKAPFIYLNTVGYNTFAFENAGSPAPWSVTPLTLLSYTDEMNLSERSINFVSYVLWYVYHRVQQFKIQRILFEYIEDMPDIGEYAKNVSFVLQNGHYFVTMKRAYLPNVAEIGCINCREPKPLEKELERFINLGGDEGFIYVSMGTAVKTDLTPAILGDIFAETFSRLPFQVIWKWDDAGASLKNVSSNVLIKKWLPQVDLLGHKNIRGFVTHSGLLSVIESAHYGVPIVAMPAFFDHDAAAASAVSKGYAVKRDFYGLTSDNLYDAIMEITQDPKYKIAAERCRAIFRDEMNTPLERAIFWIEYVIRHKGAAHLGSPARNMGIVEYYSVDVIILAIVLLYAAVSSVRRLLGYLLGYLMAFKTSIKLKTN